MKKHAIYKERTDIRMLSNVHTSFIAQVMQAMMVRIKKAQDNTVKAQDNTVSLTRDNWHHIGHVFYWQKWVLKIKTKAFMFI